jgi:hypothetical protein
MDKREALKSMLQNFIEDNMEQATLDLHNYLTLKSREVLGLDGADSRAASVAEPELDVD